MSFSLTIGTIIAVAVIAAGIIYGFVRGILKMAVGLAGWIVLVAALFLLTPLVTDFLTDNTRLPEVLYSGSRDYIVDHGNSLLASIAIHDKMDLDGESGSESESAEDADTTETARPALIENIRNVLPDNVVATIDGLRFDIALGAEHTMDQVADKVEDTAQQAINTAASAVASVWSKYLVKGIALILTYVTAKIVILLLTYIITKTDKVPVIHGFSHFFGAVVGAAFGIIWLWAGLLVAEVLSLTRFGTTVAVWVQESPLLQMIADANPLVHLLG